MRYPVFSVCLLFAMALPCRAQGDKTAHNSLTAKEVADGWLLLFDGNTLFGWANTSWKVEKRELVSTSKNSHLRSTCEFVDFELYLECMSDGSEEGVLGFGKYSERASHPVRISLRGNHPGWQKVHLTAEGLGVVASLCPSIPRASRSFLKRTFVNAQPRHGRNWGRACVGIIPLSRVDICWVVSCNALAELHLARLWRYPQMAIAPRAMMHFGLRGPAKLSRMRSTSR
jgi:hypothetical protein